MSRGLVVSLTISCFVAASAASALPAAPPAPAAPTASTSTPLPPAIVAAEPAVAAAYAEWTASQGCSKIHDYASPHAGRGTVELVLLCQALELGGWTSGLQILTSPSYIEALAAVKAGRAELAAETAWESDLDPATLYASGPIITERNFVKGIYARADSAVHTVKSLHDLRRFSAAMLKSWTVDWRALTHMDLKKSLVEVQTKEQLFQAVAKHRADFTLLEFSASPDMAQTLAGVTLYPLKGYLVWLSGKRFFAVAKAAPRGAALFVAVERGVAALRTNGTLLRALKDSGFINQKVAHWQSLEGSWAP